MLTKTTKATLGFTIVELLVALAVMGILLAAVAVAFNASIMNYQENEDIFNAVNSARQALFRMTSQLRTGQAFKLDDPDTKCTFFTSDNQDITYEYRSADNKLYLITNSDSQEYVLCEKVTAMSFIKTPTDDGLDFKSVQITMTVLVGNVEQTLSAAVAIRRNL